MGGGGGGVGAYSWFRWVLVTKGFEDIFLFKVLSLVRRKGASWSLNWPSGANFLAHLQLKCILYVPL